MTAEFDPYHKWLGIPPKDQPPHHYRLLGVEILEADTDVIDAAANQRMAYLQGLAGGDQSDASQKLLNELAAARLCLLDPEQKVAYDKKLKVAIQRRRAKKQQAKEAAANAKTPPAIPSAAPAISPVSVDPMAPMAPVAEQAQPGQAKPLNAQPTEAQPAPFASPVAATPVAVAAVPTAVAVSAVVPPQADPMSPHEPVAAAPTPGAISQPDASPQVAVAVAQAEFEQPGAAVAVAEAPAAVATAPPVAAAETPAGPPPIPAASAVSTAAPAAVAVAEATPSFATAPAAPRSRPRGRSARPQSATPRIIAGGVAVLLVMMLFGGLFYAMNDPNGDETDDVPRGDNKRGLSGTAFNPRPQRPAAPVDEPSRRGPPPELPPDEFVPSAPEVEERLLAAIQAIRDGNIERAREFLRDRESFPDGDRETAQLLATRIAIAGSRDQAREYLSLLSREEVTAWAQWEDARLTAQMEPLVRAANAGVDPDEDPRWNMVLMYRELQQPALKQLFRRTLKQVAKVMMERGGPEPKDPFGKPEPKDPFGKPEPKDPFGKPERRPTNMPTDDVDPFASGPKPTGSGGESPANSGSPESILREKGLTSKNGEEWVVANAGSLRDEAAKANALKRSYDEAEESLEKAVREIQTVQAQFNARYPLTPDILQNASAMSKREDSLLDVVKKPKARFEESIGRFEKATAELAAFLDESLEQSAEWEEKLDRLRADQQVRNALSSLSPPGRISGLGSLFSRNRSQLIRINREFQASLLQWKKQIEGGSDD